MFFPIDQNSEVPIYRQIVNAVCADIRSGKLTYGTQLPTVRTLSDRLGLARGTIKRAYDELLKLGMIEMTQGKGTFVSYREASDSRKERAMQAIDTLIEKLESLSFSPTEMAIFFDLKLRQLTARDDDIRVAVTGAPPEILYAMAEQLYGFEGVTVYRYENGFESGNGMDLTVLWAGRYYEPESDEQQTENGRHLRVAVSASPASIAALSRTGPDETVLAVAATEEFLELMHRSLREFAPETRASYTHAKDPALADKIAAHTTLLIPYGFEQLFPQEAVNLVTDAYATHKVLTCRREIDAGSMLVLKDTIRALQLQRRRGLI